MSRSVASIVAVMAVAGWPSLSMPFRGDEALFAVVARELAGGAVLYRDYWDITNPGIFWAYELAGVLFGFTEEGVRLAEWVYVTAFVLTVAHAVRRAYALDRLPVAPAVFVGVAYYLAGYSGTSLLTKTEGLAALPAFLAVWLCSRATDPAARAGRWLVAAGAAGGVLLLMKVLFGACLGACWLYLLAVFVRRRGGGLAAGARFVTGVAAGLLLVLGPAALYFAAHDATGVLVHTVFELPPRFLAEGDRAPVMRLATSAQWFFAQYSVVLAAAVIGVRCRLRAGRDPLAVALVVLLAAAAGVLLAQRLSWWPYHFLLLGQVAGVVAAYGWPAVVAATRARVAGPLTGAERLNLAAAAAVLAVPAAEGATYQYLRLATHGMGTRADDRQALRDEFGEAYHDARAETAWLAGPGARGGPIYVCGDPLYYWLSGRVPAVPVSGWSLEFYPREVRDEVAVELRQARPVYVFVAGGPHGYDALVRERYPGVRELLDAEYVPARTSAGGTWYALRPAGESGR